MKTKLFKHIGYLLFILLSLDGCVNEMVVIENEQNLEMLGSRATPPFAGYENWVKKLIDYENSADSKNYLGKVENYLQSIYRSVPEMRYVIDDLIDRGFKFRVAVKYNEKKKSWFGPNLSEIGFSGVENLKLENMMHELLHFFAFYTVDEYRKELYAAREEYEIRVLTDLFMRRDFESFTYEYQGMEIGHDEYEPYLDWLDNILANKVSDMNQFASDFIQFGISRFFGVKDEEIKIADLIGYKPRLLSVIWFYGKI